MSPGHLTLMPLLFPMGHPALVGTQMQVQQEVAEWLPKSRCFGGMGGSTASTRVGQATGRELAVHSRTCLTEGQEPESSSRQARDGEMARDN